MSNELSENDQVSLCDAQGRIRRVYTAPMNDPHSDSTIYPNALRNVSQVDATGEIDAGAQAMTSLPLPYQLPNASHVGVNFDSLSESSNDSDQGPFRLDSDIESSVGQRLSQRRRRGSSRASSRQSSPALTPSQHSIRGYPHSGASSPANSRRSLNSRGQQLSRTMSPLMNPNGTQSLEPAMLSFESNPLTFDSSASASNGKQKKALSRVMSHSGSSTSHQLATTTSGTRRNSVRQSTGSGSASHSVSASTGAASALTAAQQGHLNASQVYDTPLTAEEKNQQRLARKAEAARISRQKKKEVQGSLEDEVVLLTARVSALEDKLGPEEKVGVLPFDEFNALHTALSNALCNGYGFNQNGTSNNDPIMQQAQKCVLMSALLAHNVVLRRDAPVLLGQLCELLPPPADIALILASSIMPQGISGLVSNDESLRENKFDAATEVILPSPSELATVAFTHAPHSDDVPCAEAEVCHFSTPYPEQQSKAAIGAAIALTPSGSIVPGGILTKEYQAAQGPAGSNSSATHQPLSSAALAAARTRGIAMLAAAAAAADAGNPQQASSKNGLLSAAPSVVDAAYAQLTAPELRGVFIGALQQGAELSGSLNKMRKALVSEERQVNSVLRGLVTSLEPEELTELLQIAELEITPSGNTTVQGSSSFSSSLPLIEKLVEEVRETYPTLHDCMNVTALRELQIMYQRDQIVAPSQAEPKLERSQQLDRPHRFTTHGNDSITTSPSQQIGINPNYYNHSQHQYQSFTFSSPNSNPQQFQSSHSPSSTPGSHASYRGNAGSQR